MSSEDELQQFRFYPRALLVLWSRLMDFANVLGELLRNFGERLRTGHHHFWIAADSIRHGFSFGVDRLVTHANSKLVDSSPKVCVWENSLTALD